MRRTDPLNIEQFNQSQRRYFEKTIKRTMMPTGSPYHRRHVDELLSFAKVTAGDRLLEVGCGMGRYTLILAERGIDVTGLDLSPVLLERLRAYAGDLYELPLFAADILNPPEEFCRQFDVVAGFFTLHHLHVVDNCLAAMVSLLKPGGRLIFLEPNAYNPLYYIQIAFTPGMTWQGDKGVLAMRKGAVLRAMEHAGLVGLEVKRFGFFPPFLANRPTGRILESWLERVPFWRPILPFQLFLGHV